MATVSTYSFFCIFAAVFFFFNWFYCLKNKSLLILPLWMKTSKGKIKILPCQFIHFDRQLIICLSCVASHIVFNKVQLQMTIFINMHTYVCVNTSCWCVDSWAWFKTGVMHCHLCLVATLAGITVNANLIVKTNVALWLTCSTVWDHLRLKMRGFPGFNTTKSEQCRRIMLCLICGIKQSCAKVKHILSPGIR